MSFLKKYEGRIVILVHPLCSACAELKERLSRDERSRELVVFLDVTKDEVAQTLAEGFDISEVPVAFRITEEDGKVKVCRLDDRSEPVECMEVEYERDR